MVLKVNFPERFWSKNLKVFFNFFKVFSFGQNSQGFAGLLLTFTRPMEPIPEILRILHFYKLQSICSKNFNNFHAIFNIPSLSKLYFELFDKFLN